MGGNKGQAQPSRGRVYDSFTFSAKLFSSVTHDIIQ